MIIQNKRTQAEIFVTPEQWEKIKNHPHLKHKFKVVDTTDLKKTLTTPLPKKTVIIPEEILNFKREKIESLKTEVKPETTPEEIEPKKKTEPKKTNTQKEKT